MARRHTAERREVAPDLRYNNKLIGRLINYVMIRGKKSVAEAVTYGMLDFIKEQSKEDPLEVLMRAMDNIRPKVEVKSRRVGGATYQVPVEVSADRQLALAIRWLIQFSQARKGVPLQRAMGLEVLDAFKNQGNAIKKRDDTHKMAQANKAFAHYKW
ncbi:MAG: 30S ribosomal protein S7 [Verrucomicrobia bacterium]|nr:30S ribosomal protein S7 [Verrucomicrobiota bacterium]MBU1733848.1 30S ribosomal protein S7 [Verrucomicrobiota bacterium]MBU1856326.1 30S ribosomal protein S7 [Verrucomicrobiota bacterium]